MDRQTDRQVGPDLVAHLAGEGPLVAVDPLVLLQVGRPDEGLPAGLAPVRLEARVDLQVLCNNGSKGQGQTSRRGWGGQGVRAERRESGAPCLTFEVGVRGEGLGADLAGEGPVGRVELLVFPEGTAGGGST